MRIRKLLLGASVAALAMSASAQEQRPEYGTSIGVAQAKKLAAATIAECTKNHWNVAVAIVDISGGLVYFERMDNTQTASLDIAIMKSRVGSNYRRPSRVFADVIAKSGPAVMTLPGAVASPGGLPLFSGGKVVGGIGVSGVTGDQDEQCAKAGAAAM